jgi:DNA repair protein RecN (Recombination protein N)
VAEIARMLGGERLSNTSLAHAEEMLSIGAQASSEVSLPGSGTKAKGGKSKRGTARS